MTDRRRRAPARSRPRSGSPARQVAYGVLRAVADRDAYANLLLPERITAARLDTRDAALATELTYGTLRQAGQLDRIIARVATRPLEQIDPPVLDAVRLGAYQLLCTRVAPHAAVDTTLDAASESLTRSQTGFANALLRKIGLRSHEDWLTQLSASSTDEVERLALQHAHPRWIAQAFADALGGDLDEVAAALAADNERPSVHLVARPGRATAADLAAGVGGTAGRYSPYAVYLSAGDPGQIPAVRSGSAAVQDEGSQLAASVLTQVQITGRDERWADLCAGPGGKAGLLAAIAGQRGAKLVAIERAPHRARLVARTLRGYAGWCVIADGRQPPLVPGSMDRVMVDAPCSGLGALRRRPESRWRRQPGDIPALRRLQGELLRSALDLVRPGGVVAYVTCSPHPAETTGVVTDLDVDAELIDVRDYLPDVPMLGDRHWVQLWPHRHGTDAMFICVLRRPGGERPT